MNTKSRNYKVTPEFDNLFSFSSEKEKIEHRAQMISYRILSEVEKICEEQNIKMKDLAKMVDTSASYITQLFRGNKQVNTGFMARIEEAMSMCFEFSLKGETEMLDEISNMDLTMDLIKRLHQLNPNTNYYFAHKSKGEDTDDVSKVKKVVVSGAHKNFANLAG